MVSQKAIFVVCLFRKPTNIWSQKSVSKLFNGGRVRTEPLIWWNPTEGLRSKINDKKSHMSHTSFVSGIRAELLQGAGSAFLLVAPSPIPASAVLCVSQMFIPNVYPKCVSQCGIPMCIPNVYPKCGSRQWYPNVYPKWHPKRCPNGNYIKNYQLSLCLGLESSLG